VGRFEHTDPSEGIPAEIGTATQDLRATVEDKLRSIVEAAEAQAHEIEDRALEQALEIEQEAERKAGGRFQRSTERADQMVAAIDAFEREITQALEKLRARGRTLAAELGATPPSEPERESPQSQAAAPDEAREAVRRRVLDLFLAGEPRAEAERMLGTLEDGGQYMDLLDEVYQARTETQQGTARRRGGRRRRRPGS